MRHCATVQRRAATECRPTQITLLLISLGPLVSPSPARHELSHDAPLRSWPHPQKISCRELDGPTAPTRQHHPPECNYRRRQPTDLFANCACRTQPTTLREPLSKRQRCASVTRAHGPTANRRFQLTTSQHACRRPSLRAPASAPETVSTTSATTRQVRE